MATSKVEICNMALLRISAKEIQSLNERSKEAIYCNRFYDRIRLSVLRRHPWGFATKTTRLTPLASSDLDYDYAYVLPADYVRVNQLKIEGSETPVPYTVRGKNLYTDYENPILVYGRDVTDPNDFDPQFIDAFAYLLASELANPVASKPSLKKTEYQMFQLTISSAAATDASESREEVPLGQDFVNARV